MGHLETVRMLRWADACDRGFLRALDETPGQRTARAGAHLVWRIGCTDWCLGSFSIAALEDDCVPPCRLCFTSASAADVEASRVAIDPVGEEEALLASITGTSPDEGDAMVAHALVAARGVAR